MRDLDILELIGDTSDGERPPPKVVFSYRCLNRIELHLEEQQTLEVEMIPYPMPFIENDVFANGDDFVEGETLTLSQALALRQAYHRAIADKYKRQIIAARELGDDSTAKLADYLLICKHDGIEPFPNGVAFVEEPWRKS